MEKEQVKVSKFTWLLFMCYIFFIYTAGQLLGGKGSRLSGLILLMPVVLMFVKCLFEKKGFFIKINSYLFYILCFSLYCIMSGLWAVQSSLSIDKGVDLLEVFIMMFVVYSCFQYEQSVDRLLKAIMYASYLVMLYEIQYYGWTYFTTVVSDSVRITSEFVNSNTLGLCVAFAIIINVHLLITQKIHIWTVGLIILGVVILAASGSRKALVSVILGIVLVLIFKSYDRLNKANFFIKILITSFVLVLILYFVLQMSIFSNVLERMQEMTNIFNRSGKIERSAQLRQIMVELGWDLFKKNPFVGIGIDNPRLYTLPYVGESCYLHNNYIELLAGGGVIGIIIYYWIYAVILKTFIKKRRFDDPGYNICLVLLVILLMMDYGMVSYYSKLTYVYLMVIFMQYKLLKAQG